MIKLVHFAVTNLLGDNNETALTAGKQAEIMSFAAFRFHQPRFKQ